MGTKNVKVHKKTKEVFETFLSGKAKAGELGMDLLNKLNSDKYHIDLTDSFGETVLMKAVRKNNKKLVDFLLWKRASITHQDLEGETALMVAAKSGNYQMTKMLLGKLLDLKKLKKGLSQVLSDERKTALMQAAELGHMEVCTILLAHGAKLKNVDIVSTLYLFGAYK